jgi:hypothetical protein
MNGWCPIFKLTNFSNTGVRSKEVFCEGGKIVIFIYPAVGRLFKMAGFTLYYVPLN